MSIFLDFFDNDPFNDHFLRNPFGFSSILEFEDINHVVEDHIVEEITHVVEDHVVEEITESKTCFSHNPIVRSFIGFALKMTAPVEDTTMDVVPRPLMFEDECILIAPLGKWGEHELDYLLRDLALHPNREEVVEDKYVSKEQMNFIRKPRKVKMELHQQRKRNKHGPFNKKVKMKCMKCFVVSLAKT